MCRECLASVRCVGRVLVFGLLWMRMGICACMSCVRVRLSITHSVAAFDLMRVEMASRDVSMIDRALKKAARTSKGKDGPWQSERARMDLAVKVCQGNLHLTPGAKLTMKRGWCALVHMLCRRVEAGKRAWDEQYVYFLSDGVQKAGWMKASATLIKDLKEVLADQAREYMLYLPSSEPCKPDSPLPEPTAEAVEKAIILAPERYYLCTDSALNSKTDGKPTVCVTAWKVGMFEAVEESEDEEAPATPEATMADK